MITNLIVCFIAIGSLIGQLVICADSPAARRERTTPRRSGRRRSPVELAVAAGTGWASAAYGCPPIGGHRAPRDVAVRRDMADRIGVAVR